MTNDQLIQQSWQIIAPLWPLSSVIAVNPLQGFTQMHFTDAVQQAAYYFQQTTLPDTLYEINRQTQKWCQVFFDNGQARLPMPMQNLGLWTAWRPLVVYDKQLHLSNPEKICWLQQLPTDSSTAITLCLQQLAIPEDNMIQFCHLLLSTLPGWASYIKYLACWQTHHSNTHDVSLASDYLALRLVLTVMIDVSLHTHMQQTLTNNQDNIKNQCIQQITHAEYHYQWPLLKNLQQSVNNNDKPSSHIHAQLIFCIDTRSEPLRRCIEQIGGYQTYSLAGFFGLPIQIENTLSLRRYSSCPVLLTPSYTVVKQPLHELSDTAVTQTTQYRIKLLQRIFSVMKYTFTTPFALVDLLGMLSGLYMAIRTFLPNLAKYGRRVLRSLLGKQPMTIFNIRDIPFADQLSIALSVLKTIGLTHHFAPLVVFCGHGSSSQNNAYASALDCGACGGHHGANNARIITQILNQTSIRKALAKEGITIDDSTVFIAAEHNTTTDVVTVFTKDRDLAKQQHQLVQLKRDLDMASQANALKRSWLANLTTDKLVAIGRQSASIDWAEVRPEWGLAGNALFIIAPRHLTQSLDLYGQAFLHSYDATTDTDGCILTGIMTAPLLVAQWINSQYLFSTLDNVAYGSGSKITQNIVGKFAIMQGNSSDLMTGLPLQSVYQTDNTPYHRPIRLMAIVYAPGQRIMHIIEQQPEIKQLICFEWIKLVMIDPDDHHFYWLKPDLTWQPLEN